MGNWRWENSTIVLIDWCIWNGEEWMKLLRKDLIVGWSRREIGSGILDWAGAGEEIRGNWEGGDRGEEEGEIKCSDNDGQRRKVKNETVGIITILNICFISDDKPLQPE